jgi:hypothetical protein
MLPNSASSWARLHTRRPIVIWGLIVLLFVLWLLGFSFSVGGGFIHLLLVLALIVLIFNFLSGRRTV